ncbi:hypothetical protein NECAME_07607 [Necator americanus]|uniref:Uncharacterized protein n=1 Tax=Necator americanus TaxID=51031 RepID=W2TLN4_NECAM|nr:hypothetical protein NECAME_07607 [Necator americanus]ETN83015.1 hypothetical protein NECAME_07607 [Necator americanus]
MPRFEAGEEMRLRVWVHTCLRETDFEMNLKFGPANARTLASRRRCVYVLLSTSRRCRHTNESGVQSTTTTSALTSPQQSYHSHIYRSIPTPIVIDSF